MFRSLKRLLLALILIVIFFCGFLLGSEQYTLSDVQTSLMQGIQDAISPETAKLYRDKLTNSVYFAPAAAILREIVENIADSICNFLSDML